MKLININSYSGLPDYQFTTENWQHWMKNPTPTGLIYVDHRLIPDFFEMCNRTKNRYIILSQLGDFTICKNDKSHLIETLVNLYTVGRDDIVKYIRDNQVTENIIINNRYFRDLYNPTDKYMLKLSTNVIGTFDYDIPENVVAWCGTNIDLDDPKIIHLPFGVNYPWPDDCILKQPVEGIRDIKNKDNNVYLNFSNNTYERILLKDIYAFSCRFNIQQNIDHHLHMYYLGRTDFTLCPIGEGLDCYRTYEALFMGSIPIIQRRAWCQWMEDIGLPVILVDDLKVLKINDLQEKKEKLNLDWNRELISEEYWRAKILKTKELL